jgi:DNA mismatch endonuclease, patch repair protein
VADVFSTRKRSQVMSRIRSRGNKDTELVLAELFRRQRITGWRRNQRIFGKPDFVFPKLKLAVFVDGCFWHRCPIHGTQPKVNRSFWKKKFACNQARAWLVNRTLRLAGWCVLRIWEHELARTNEARLLRRIQRVLSGPLHKFTNVLSGLGGQG